MAGRFFFKNSIQEDQLQLVPRRSWTPSSGRGELVLLEFPDGEVAERTYRHGGLHRLFFPQLFFKNDRPKREFEVHDALFRTGFPTPEPMGWREIHTRIPFVCRYTYFSRWIPDSTTVPQLLSSGEFKAIHLEQIALAIATLFRQKIWHGDLNLNNWIISQDRVFLLDFDRAKPLEDPRPFNFLFAVFHRMGRSGRKLGFDHEAGRKILTRLMLLSAGLLDVEPKKLIAQVQKSLGKKRFYHKWAWVLSGGHREP